MAERDIKPRRPRKALTARQRWVRWLLRLGLAAVLLLAVGAWVVTREGFIIWMVRPELEKKLGGEVDIGAAAYLGGGAFAFHDMTLRVRGVRGPAGEVVKVDHLLATIDMPGLWTASIDLREVTLDGILLRVSESVSHPGEFTFQSLRPDWSDQSDGAPPPRVTVSKAMLELGQHDGESYEMVSRRTLAGQFAPLPDSSEWFSFALQEVDDQGQALIEDGLSLQGRFNARTLEHEARLGTLRLNPRTRAMLPRFARLWWDQMELEGQVSGAVLHWKPNTSLKARMTIHDAALTLPVEAEGLWAKFRNGVAEPTQDRPRLRVGTGDLTLEDGSLIMENLTGDLPVPYRINLTVSGIPEVDWRNKQEWMNQVLAGAAFRMEVELDDFSYGLAGAEPDQDIELPHPVARWLEKFRMTRWSLSTSVVVTRDAPIIEDSVVREQPIRWVGSATIEQGWGSYFKFPYPLQDVTARIEFDPDELRVVELTGRGPTGAIIRIAGRIWPPANDAAVSLHVVADQMPLDDVLRAAVGKGPNEAFDALMNPEEHQRLVDAGLLDGAAGRQTVRDMRQALMDALTQLSKDEAVAPADLAARRQELQRRLERLDRVLDAGPFQLGGVVDLDLNVNRPYGRHQRTVTTGGIKIRRVGIVHRHFPYPLQVLSGQLLWREDGIAIVPSEQGDGLQFVTPAGGLGTVTGRIAMPRIDGDIKVRPDLVIDVQNDQPNELLYAAIPAGSDETRIGALSESGRLVKSLGLDGTLDSRGTIQEDEQGKAKYEFIVDLRHGAASPAPDLGEIIGRSGLVWPREFNLSNVNGRVRVTPKLIEVLDTTGSHGEGEVKVDATVDLAASPSQTQLQMGFSSLAMERYLLNLVPRENIDRVRALWDRYDPEGRFDAQLSMTIQKGRDVAPLLCAQPMEVTINAGQERVTLTRQDGHLYIEGQRVRFDRLKLGVATAGREEGVLELDGSYGMSDAGDQLQVNGSWQDGKLESALIIEALALVGAQKQVAQMARLAPQGTFDSTFSYRSARENQAPEYEFLVQPGEVSFTLDGARVNAVLDEGSSLRFNAGRVEFPRLSGRHDAGEFAVSGFVEIEPVMKAELEVSHRGPISPQLRAFLPPGVKRAIDAIELKTDQWMHLDKGRVSMTRANDAPGGAEDAGSRWIAEFRGPVQTHGVSFLGGLPFTQVDGVFDIAAGQDAHGRATMDIRAQVDRALVEERELTDITARIRLSDDQRTVHVEDFTADSYGGSLTAASGIGLREGDPWTLDVEAVGVGLGGFSRPWVARSPAELDTSANTGEMFGKLSLAGEIGFPDRRRGGGSVRVINGRFANMPLTLSLLQILQLMLPLSDSLNFADVSFYVQGNWAVFEKFYLSGPTISFIGEGGEMKVDTMALNLRFRPRGTMPLVSNVVGGLSDQLYAIQVEGPLNDPKARLIPLPGMSRQPMEHTVHGAATTSGQPPIAAAPER